MNPEFEDVLPIVRDISVILKDRKATVATMESCTAGLISYYLTALDGSSEYIKRSFVTYCNEAKIALGVKPVTIEKYSVYSIEVAKEMALMASGPGYATYGLGITGMCGTESEAVTAGNGVVIPAGTVCIAVYGDREYTSNIINVRTIQDRNDKRCVAAVHALALLHRHLLYVKH